MTISTLSGLALRQDGFILHITLDRPDTLNSLDDELVCNLREAVMHAGRDEHTRVVVISGAGKAFSAGGNLDAIKETIEDPKRFVEGVRNGRALLESILDCPKPIIAKVNGAAMGLGATIALFSDIAIAAEHAKIADPHVRMGLVAGDGGAVIWPALMGYHRAKRFLLTGDAITGKEAAEAGLIDSAVPADELDSVVETLARRISANPPLAVQWTKASMNIGLKHLALQVLDTSVAYETLTSRSKDHLEALEAFMEKREPSFTGE